MLYYNFPLISSVKHTHSRKHMLKVVLFIILITTDRPQKENSAAVLQISFFRDCPLGENLASFPMLMLPKVLKPLSAPLVLYISTARSSKSTSC